MDRKRMIELLEIEHECMLRGAHDDCDRNCADCDLVQDDGDLHEMYTEVIAMLKEQEAPSRTDLMQRIAKYFREREDDSETIEINADDMREIVYWNHRAWKCAQLEKAGKMLE